MPVQATTYVSSNGSHDSQVVLGDDLLHLLNASQVSQHVSNRGYERVSRGTEELRSPDRDDVASLDELFSDMLGIFYGTTGDRLKVIAVSHGSSTEEFSLDLPFR